MAVIAEKMYGNTKIRIMDDYMPKTAEQERIVNENVARVVMNIFEDRIRQSL